MDCSAASSDSNVRHSVRQLFTAARHIKIGIVNDQEIFAAIGEKGFERLVAAFYRRVPHYDVLSRLYPKDDLPGAEQRLRDFLIFRFGGPPATSKNAVTRACACVMLLLPSIALPATTGYRRWKQPWRKACCRRR